MTEPQSPSTLVVFAHPALERARVNAALGEAAAAAPGVTFLDLYEVYPDFAVDVAAEQRRLAEHRVVVLQFPLYWYSSPALLKEWQDLVWLPGFAYGEGGRGLQGKTLACAVSTHGRQSTYELSYKRRFSLEEILRPFEQAAYLCGMEWAEPFASHASSLREPGAMAGEAERYRGWLAALAAAAAEPAAA
jgi:glutathione-regulated potassium-efflux system ancillary protein KefG